MEFTDSYKTEVRKCIKEVIYWLLVTGAMELWMIFPSYIGNVWHSQLTIRHNFSEGWRKTTNHIKEVIIHSLWIISIHYHWYSIRWLKPPTRSISMSCWPWCFGTIRCSEDIPRCPTCDVWSSAVEPTNSNDLFLLLGYENTKIQWDFFLRKHVTFSNMRIWEL